MDNHEVQQLTVKCLCEKIKNQDGMIEALKAENSGLSKEIGKLVSEKEALAEENKALRKQVEDMENPYPYAPTLSGRNSGERFSMGRG